jgi:alpha-amylase/alpha-mannosidase (GH57 family)
MAETIIQALEKYGAGVGDARKRVVEHVKAKFAEARDSTIRTQVYRGTIYLRSEARAGGRSS